MSFQYSWIRSFHFTAKLGSIAQASQFLGLSSSTLSHQIKDLENTFKVKLFYRSGNKIYLTNIGLSLKKITDRYFSSEQDIKVFLGKVKNRVNKVLNIGAENPVKVIPLLKVIRKKQDQVRYNLFFEKNDLLMEMFLKNKVDVLVINKRYFEFTLSSAGMEEKELPRIDALPFYVDRLILAVHETYPLRNQALQDGLPWESIMEERLILPHKSFASRFFFDNLCGTLQLFPHKTLEISSREGVVTAIKNGLGIGVVLESEISGRSGIVSLPFHLPQGSISEKDLSVEEYVYFNHNIADLTLIKKFIKIIQSYHQEEETFHHTNRTIPHGK